LWKWRQFVTIFHLAKDIWEAIRYYDFQRISLCLRAFVFFFLVF